MLKRYKGKSDKHPRMIRHIRQDFNDIGILTVAGMKIGAISDGIIAAGPRKKHVRDYWQQQPILESCSGDMDFDEDRPNFRQRKPRLSEKSDPVILTEECKYKWISAKGLFGIRHLAVAGLLEAQTTNGPVRCLSVSRCVEAGEIAVSVSDGSFIILRRVDACWKFLGLCLLGSENDLWEVFWIVFTIEALVFLLKEGGSETEDFVLV
jgi:hypothetical protein